MKRSDLSPLTIASIELQPLSNVMDLVRSCGCDLDRGRSIHLCAYHEGYEDGIEAARKEQQ